MRPMFTKTKFSSFNLNDDLQSAISNLGWDFVTQVQKETIPLALAGRDVIGQARTGSGKTASFGIPVLNKCMPTGKLQALILTPTRELAGQVADELTNLAGSSDLKILTVYGGTDLEKQAKQLQSGVDIVVGTPGRVMDMTKRSFLDIENASFFVLDEADRMLDMGFFPDVMWIVEKMPNRQQNLLFSATFPQEVIDAANEFSNDPEYVLTSEEKLDIPPIEQYSVRIGRSNKLWVLGRLLIRMEDDDQTIIFTNTKRMVDLLVKRLKKHRFKVEGIHGDMTQKQRESIISTLKDGSTTIVVATDVAARGIDIDGITLVVNYDVPDDVDSYIHRIGRTGRIGRKGEAWALVSRDDVQQLSKIIATHSLNVLETDVPELPEGIDRDPVARQDDISEYSDVYGMVKISLKTEMSQAELAKFIMSGINCSELAIGDIVSSGERVSVEVHSKFSSLAMKFMNSKGIESSLVE